MVQFHRGQRVAIPCDIRPGPFDDRLVTIQTDSGTISGFIRSEHLRETAGPSGYVLGVVDEVTPTTVKIRIPGSFFTSALGLTSVSTGWANTHLQLAAA